MQLLLNDQIYVLDLTALHDDAAGDVDAALQPLVDRLSSSVRVMETEQLRRRRLQAALAEVYREAGHTDAVQRRPLFHVFTPCVPLPFQAEEELEPLEKIRKECLAKAHTSAKIRAWAGAWACLSRACWRMLLCACVLCFCLPLPFSLPLYFLLRFRFD